MYSFNARRNDASPNKSVWTGILSVSSTPSARRKRSDSGSWAEGIAVHARRIVLGGGERVERGALPFVRRPLDVEHFYVAGSGGDRFGGAGLSEERAEGETGERGQPGL